MMASQVAVVAVVALMVALVGAKDATRDSTNCPVSFQGKCHCGMAYSLYDNQKDKKKTVNCTNTGFTTTTMLRDLPEDTEVLIFSGNSIPELHENILDVNKTYDFLETIDMSNNHIKFISGRSFHRVYTVTTFILNHNDLEITEGKKRPRVFSNFDNLENLHLTNAFTERIDASDYLLSLEDIFYESDLIYLKVLHLEQNEIWSIGDSQQVFCELTRLEQVLLGDNRLMDLDFKIDCLQYLRYIDLERNMIPRLSDDATQKLDMFKNKAGTRLRLNLDQNPFVCDCRSRSFVHWLNTTKIDFRENGRDLREQLSCEDGYPDTNVGKKLITVQQLECPSDNHHHSSTTKHSHEEHSAAYDYDYHDGDYDHEDDHPHFHRRPSGYSSSTIGALSFLLVFTTSLLLAVAYFHRQKLKDVAYPYWDYLTRKIGYTGIANEEAPQEVNV